MKTTTTLTLSIAALLVASSAGAQAPTTPVKPPAPPTATTPAKPPAPPTATTPPVPPPTATPAPTPPPAATTAPPSEPPAPPADPVLERAPPIEPEPPPPAAAISFPPPATGSSGADTTSDDGGGGSRYGEGDRGAFVAGGKFGMLASFSDLGPNITGAIEVGYILPFLDRSFAVLIDVGYAAPVATGEEADPRVEGGGYAWHLVQKQLTLAPSAYYRLTMFGDVLGDWVPFVGIGPRIFFTESVTDSDEAAPMILETSEQSTTVGLGVQAGVEFLIGPGAAVGEVLFQYAELDHTATGAADLAGLDIWVGYRFML